MFLNHVHPALYEKVGCTLKSYFLFVGKIIQTFSFLKDRVAKCYHIITKVTHARYKPKNMCETN